MISPSKLEMQAHIEEYANRLGVTARMFVARVLTVSQTVRRLDGTDMTDYDISARQRLMAYGFFYEEQQHRYNIF